MFLGLFQSIIGIWQFIIQKSIGLIWLKESIISPETLGVAKIVIGSEIYLRAYGLFPHPNVLGGFLFISIILTALSKKLFHACPKQVSHVLAPPIVPRGTILKFKSRMFHVEQFFRNVKFWWIAIAIQVLALILTFSKSAILGIIISLAYIFTNQTRNVPRLARESENVPPSKALVCSTWNILEPRGKRGTFSDFYGLELLKRYFILSMLFFGFLLFYFKIDLYSLFIQSLEERLIYLAISIKAIASHIFFGLGNGQFVLEMQKYVSTSLDFWQYQPVHNVFLLILSELGIIGLFLFIWFLLELFANVPNSHKGHKMFRACPVDSKCSTWNISNLYGVEQSKENNRESLLNNNINNLSSCKISTYFKAILLGFIFIMLFDHYLWDIQQGEIMLWMIIGLSAGLNFKKIPK